MSNIKGSFFPYQVIPAKALGALGAKAVRDGVLTGCAVSFTGASLTIGKGFLIACGRVMEVPGKVTLSIDGATSGYARVSVKIDTTKTSTREAFDQADFLVEYSSTEDGFTEAYAEDVNLDGTLYQLPLCVVSLSSAGISGVVGESAEAAAAGLTVIWENAAPTAAFSAQKLTLKGLRPGGMLMIDWVVDFSIEPPPHAVTLLELPESGSRFTWHSIARGMGGAILAWGRSIMADVEAGTLEFNDGIYTEAPGSSPYTNIMVPQRISILR